LNKKRILVKRGAIWEKWYKFLQQMSNFVPCLNIEQNGIVKSKSKSVMKNA